MNPRLRVVFDTNIYIAAALNPAGLSEAWLRIAGRQARSFDLYTSPAILHEVQDKLLHKFGLPEANVRHFVQHISKVAAVVNPQYRLKVVKTDPKDNMLFECAVEAKAHLLVSADKAVRRLSPYGKIGICHPKDLKAIFAQDLRYI